MTEEMITEQPTVTFDSFDGSPIAPEEQVAAPSIAAEIPAAEPKPELKPEVVEPNPVTVVEEDGRVFLKEKLGYEDWDAAKKEIEALKSKPKEAAELKYESLDHDKIKELYSAIDKKEKLGKLIEGEVTKEIAADIIKISMAQKGLSSDMVNHRFKKLYSIPDAPKEEDFIDTDEFDIAKNKWKGNVADIEMEMLIEANLLKPEIQKLHSEIKLPEIPQAQSAENTFTPEDLELMQKEADQFVKNAGDAINNFEGFNVSYKDKDVDIQTNYSLSQDEKAAVLDKMKLLAEQNYNANAVFAQRWVNDDSTFNFVQIAKDLAILETHDKSAQKFVSDAATKATLKFIKDKHNVDLKGVTPSGDLQLEDKSTQQKTEDAIWN